MTLGFTITKYKVQGATIRIVILYLQRNTKIRNKDSYKKLCSTYVQLLRLQILDRLDLLQPVTLDNIENKPYLTLSKESLNLNKISD